MTAFYAGGGGRVAFPAPMNQKALDGIQGTGPSRAPTRDCMTGYLVMIPMARSHVSAN
jgi:hypothetical protein